VPIQNLRTARSIAASLGIDIDPAMLESTQS
jgi:hypothetical protein